MFSGKQRDVIVAVVGGENALVGAFLSQLNVGHEGDGVGGVGEIHIQATAVFCIAATNFIVAGDAGVERHCWERLQCGEVIRVIGDGVPVEIVGEDSIIVVDELEFYEMDGGEIGGPVDRAEIGGGAGICANVVAMFGNQ